MAWVTVSSVYAYGGSRCDGCGIARECTGTGCVGDLESAGGTDATTVAVVTMDGGMVTNEGAFMTGCMALGSKKLMRVSCHSTSRGSWAEKVQWRRNPRKERKGT